MRVTYDERGNQTGGSLRHRRQALLAQGRVCRMEGHLRPAGKPDEPVLFRRRRQALPVKGGYAGWKAAYDERGNMTHVSYFGAAATLALTFFGIGGWNATFDERGNQSKPVLLRSEGGTHYRPQTGIS